jgi:hypothetical protein
VNLASILSHPKAAPLLADIFDIDEEPFDDTADDTDERPDNGFSMTGAVQRFGDGSVAFAIDVTSYGFDDGEPLLLGVIDIRRMHASLGKWLEAHDFVVSAIGSTEGTGQ